MQRHLIAATRKHRAAFPAVTLKGVKRARELNDTVRLHCTLSCIAPWLSRSASTLQSGLSSIFATGSQRNLDRSDRDRALGVCARVLALHHAREDFRRIEIRARVVDERTGSDLRMRGMNRPRICAPHA
jgi:hypothetical protein